MGAGADTFGKLNAFLQSSVRHPPAVTSNSRVALSPKRDRGIGMLLAL
jgi:hypothetical protein